MNHRRTGYELLMDRLRRELSKDFRSNAASVVETLRERKPDTYVGLLLKLIDKDKLTNEEGVVGHSAISRLTDAELKEELRRLVQSLDKTGVLSSLPRP